MVPFTANLAARFGLGPPISKQPGSSRPPGMIIRGAPLERPPRFTNVRSILGPRTTSDHRRYIEHWINLALEHGDPLEQYHNQYFAEGKGSVDWEDIRIRPFTFEERSANMRWLESAEDLFVLQQLPKVRGQKRAVRDLRECCYPLLTFSVKGTWERWQVRRVDTGANPVYA